MYLGIDLGTQGVRAALVAIGDAPADPGTAARPGSTAAGTVATATHPLRSRREGDRHEQDPDDWWTAVRAVSRQVIASVRESGDHRPIAGVSVDATSGTVLVEGPDLRPVTPGIMYDDGRAGDLAPTAAAAGADVWARAGITLQRSWALPRVMWLLAAGLVPTGGRVVHQGDHINSRLTGLATPTDINQALKTGADLVDIAWPTAVFDALGIDPAVLPGLVLPSAPIGTVGDRAAEETGIPAGTPVRAGTTDGCAAQIAGGALRPGTWSSALGTTLVIKGTSSAPLVDPTGAVYAHRSPDGGWLPGGASNIGAGIVGREFAGVDLGRITAEAADLEVIPGVCYPLTTAGERFPFAAAGAEGFSEGVPEGRAARFGAILQGIAFTERLAYRRLAALGAQVAGPVSFSGGSTANEYWNQLRCDLLGVPVRIMESSEACVGAAVLAAAGPGEVASTAERMVRVGRTYHPDPVRAARFDDSYDAFEAALRTRGWLVG
ncbi:carbohydrate kinase [Nakamurella sp. YIM 132087]|uniref:Carbohydrate kinase n=1 Tax=Nakamurella alba TaxID=2665158 RepID=A0A7K1FVS5_9ACTN|nr:carbohydrate kinase [Nakamurella alba]